MKKFNWIDGLIVLLVIAVAAGGYWYLNHKGKASLEKSSKIEFTVEVSKVPLAVAEAYHIGDEVTFGTKNVDTGVISKVEILPHSEEMTNSGSVKLVPMESFYNANVTIKTVGRVTDEAMQSSQEVLNVGTNMIFHGKGFAGKGFIIGLKALKEGE